jgi:biopolymer transport protein ExbD
MTGRQRRRRGYREVVAADLDLMPMMNLFIAIIPLLLLSAVFVQVTVIDMNLPTGDRAETLPLEEPLGLTVRIRDDAYVVEANGHETRTIARGPVADGAADPAAAGLTAALAAIGQAHPDNREVRLMASATTRYEELVAVMDLARAAGLPEAGLADDDGEGR